MAHDKANDNQPQIPVARCPICNKPTNLDFRPFCSKRCSDVDLQRWLSGRYAIPVEEEDGPDETSGEDGRE